ncbi:helicase-related protein [Herbiconiux sp. SYSU D00978]|uniref:helicase-related protein n=1 Tax=Herbiconiux sp. SYSU D00978 TaxID=2812562 RepID=UPI0027DD2A32|nr:helicase-related protein [Herbiconiux sp. SYSU D00978]
MIDEDRRALNVAPGSVVVVRDEEWLVTSVDETDDGPLLHVYGLSELVRDTTASFYPSIEGDGIEVLDPREAKVVADDSSGYRRARLWVESTLRKSALPLSHSEPTVSTRMLANPLGYQQAAVRQALSPENLRPRILLADAVGLGKTLEIGMILAELVRRGRGDRILIVTPKHVLEQMQQEMWTRFALPFVRLDSLGIQRIRQLLPATRNPFTYYKRVIISVDTLKSERYLAHLRTQKWDAVVIDESHNLTNTNTQNNALARVLAPNTEALILASATPHNGKPESFAELVRLLEPTAVRPDGSLIEEEVRRLVIRRHRQSPDVKAVVGADWAERMPPQHLLVPPSPEEDAIARELDEVWLHPTTSSPYSGANSALFPWTLAKAFLSSPEALAETVKERLSRIKLNAGPEAARERDALERLAHLAAAALGTRAGKFAALATHLKSIGVGKGSDTRVVIFAERLPTLNWLAKALPEELKMPTAAVDILHGGLTDEQQMQVIERFKLESAPVRILVTGDVASEGVNLHKQCHHLVHYDIPWSLIRIEQRNGRIDRYGQKHRPQITTLLLDPSSERFSGDLRVLSRLLDKEEQARLALGDSAALMGEYDVAREEEKIRQALAGKVSFDEVVPEVTSALNDDPVAAFLASLGQLSNAPAPDRPKQAEVGTGLFGNDVEFLREALEEAFITPGSPARSGGVDWREFPNDQVVELAPPADLRQRLEVLPQSYLADRRVVEKLTLATNVERAQQILSAALTQGSTWPEAHFLGPLHPVLDWAADRALSALDRNRVFVVRGAVDAPRVLLLGTLTNQRGQTVTAAHVAVDFPAGPSGFHPQTPYGSAAEMLASAGVQPGSFNPGPVPDESGYSELIAPAVDAVEQWMLRTMESALTATDERVDSWARRVEAWEHDAGALVQTAQVRQRRSTVDRERELLEQLRPARRALVTPLLVVVPQGVPAYAAQ